jgi:hypothetical protein
LFKFDIDRHFGYNYIPHGFSGIISYSKTRPPKEITPDVIAKEIDRLNNVIKKCRAKNKVRPRTARKIRRIQNTILHLEEVMLTNL